MSGESTGLLNLRGPKSCEGSNPSSSSIMPPAEYEMYLLMYDPWFVLPQEWLELYTENWAAVAAF